MFANVGDVNVNLFVVESYETARFAAPTNTVAQAFRNWVLKYPMKSPG
jgi:hypothetical protein